MTRGFAVFLLLIAVTALGTLGLRPLYKADESRYAEIPREMAASGDWVTPRLNGFKYFEKPPLQYWATATFFHAFGESDGAARLWTALTAIGGIALVLVFGRRFFGAEAGALGAMVLAGCPLYVLLMQVNTLDMALTFFLSLAIFAFAAGRYYLFWAACALAVLSKGLVGIVLPLGAVGLYILVKRDWTLIRNMKPLRGGALFLAICAPWFVAVSLANGEFAHFFFVQEHFQRFTTRMHGRYQPLWYFLPILAFGLAPWLALLFGSLFKRPPIRQAGFDPSLFLLIWVVLVFAFFSASSSKLPSYILPLFPALALLLGKRIAEDKPRNLLILQGGLAVLGAVALVLLSFELARFVPQAGRDGELYLRGGSYAQWLVMGSILLALCSLCALMAAWRSRIGLAIALLSFGAFGTTLVAMVSHGFLSPLYSIAPQLAGLGPVPKEARIFAVDYYDHTLPWYFGRTVTMVRYKDELGEPIKWEAQKFIAELPEFAAAWRAAPAAYAVFNTEKYDSLSKEIGAPMQVVSRGPRYTIARKP